MAAIKQEHPHYGRDISWVIFRTKADGKWWMRLQSGRYWLEYGYREGRPDVEKVLPELKKHFIRHKRAYRRGLK